MTRLVEKSLWIAALTLLVLPLGVAQADVLQIQDGVTLDSVTYAGTQSNWMRQDAPTSPLTSNAIMRVGEQGSGFVRRSVIRFTDLSTLDLGFTSGQITSARLLLTTDTAFEGAGTAELRVLGASDNGWVENEVSWDNKATATAWAGGGGAGTNYGSVIDTVSWSSPDNNPSPLVTPLAFDLTGAALDVVKGWIDGSGLTAGFILRSADESSTLGFPNYIDFYSEDFATTPGYRPVLEITYIPEPASVLLLAAGTGLMLVRRKRVG